ncbi:PBS lyase HEAT domain-containing protein repeat-containing protein [Calothrix sp. NIES-4071]|nr:PBS lyase HEAT domain-containing protein repeat-containing protein [Calothrix sp. NIES-4071]BAZ55542.1 PBS lyase HEAT domain-containing protein repeat-containing protein [Calothrix sp. NIES-4105]
MTVEPLLQILQKPVVKDNLGVQVLAIKVLGLFADKRVINLLIQFLQNSHFLIRTAAIRALGELNDVRALQPLRQLTQDEAEDDYVKKIAVMALQKIEQSN